MWGALPRTGLISDEGEYLSAATWLAEGRSFSWYQGYLWTRAPLYPLFVAAHLRLFGGIAPVYISQALLSLLNIALVYLLALRILPPGAAQVRRPLRLAPAGAALLMGLYLPFATYTQVLLSETLYITLLLAGFLALAYSETGSKGQLAIVACAGVLLGLSTLTRSLTLAFLPVVALWLLVRRSAGESWRNRLRARFFKAAVFSLAAMLVLLPWTAYNSRMYGGLVVVDTTGAYNLLLGARTAFDGVRQDAPTRDFVLGLFSDQQPSVSRAESACAQPYPGPQPSQAARQQAMTAEGLCLIRARPLAFAEKSLGELLDFFQINYSGDERFTDEFTLGRMPTWYALALFLLDDTLYVFTLPLAVLGWALAREATKDEGRRTKDGGPTTNDRRPGSVGLPATNYQLPTIGSQLPTTNYQLPTTSYQLPILHLIGLWWLYTVAVAPLLFAINRFRLPLLPFAFILAVYALSALPRGGWSFLRSRRGLAWAALALGLWLLAATPYAYLEPAVAGRGSDWASYFGRFPSSVVSTQLAVQARPVYLQREQFREALRDGDAEAAELLRPERVEFGRVSGSLATPAQIADALLLSASSRPEDALALLPEAEALLGRKDVEATVARADLLRTLGRDDEANALLTAQYVDDTNPVGWAWDWLHPVATTRINIGGNLDIGYLRGCYLGESIAGFDDANYRWCTDGAQLRFPGAGTGVPQTLTLRADGRGWAGFAPTVPAARVLVNDAEAGSFTASMAGPAEYSITLPPTPPDEDVVVTLRTPTFIPPAADYNRQQGPQAGQARRLGVRLDWAELR